ncbi:hypothetical protein IWQ57_000657 [Coemansia nantahalensis]|uniref:Uncharacterized protein n=2 Tax=Coemansia TaxID=4863 RepID=A0ACC1LDZ6_9FUNG|nr:hypothetical protein IWQ57_000657 [Coemansia nantahalensis]KAJ2806274.1 hypothetical protein H4R21_000937 [Coemansia helicoidea]
MAKASSAVLADADGHLQKTQTGAAENVNIDGDQSRFSAVLGILRKFIGVADIINLRLSLPSQLLDPVPNLEYWNYMDSPRHFVA